MSSWQTLLLTSLSTVVLATMAPAISRAASITHSAQWDLSVGLDVTSSGDFDFFDARSVTLPFFDRSIGELTEVRIERISGVHNVFDFAENSSVNAATLSYRRSVIHTADPFLETLGFSSSTSQSPSLAPEQPLTLVGGGGIPSEGSRSLVLVGDEVLPFIGSGFFDLSPEISIQGRATLPPGVRLLVESNYAFAYNVTYVSDPIPEPASALLFGVASLVVGRALRKRSSQADK